jgi:endonuclease/exonuclease/phosphatase family metal-dependent hydrolase
MTASTELLAGRATAPLGLRTSRPGAMSALVALTVVLALELVRIFPPLLAWHLRGHDLGGAAWAGLFIAPVVGAVAAVLLAARRDPRVVLLVGAVLLGLARGAVQLSGSDAQAALAGIGLLGALAVLGVLATMGLPLFGGGVIAGVMFDAALQAGLGTRPLAWIDSPWALLLVVVLVVWHLALVGARCRRDVFVLGRSMRASVPLLVVGPVVVVEAFMLGSLGWVAHSLGAGWLAASTVIAVAGGAGVLAAFATARWPDGGWTWAAVGGGGSLAALAWAHAAPGPWWAVAVVAAQVGIGSTLTAGVSRGVGSGSKIAPAAILSAGYLTVLAALTTLDGRGVLGVALAPSAIAPVVGVLGIVAAVIARRELAPRPHRPGRIEAGSLAAVFVVPAALVLAGAPVIAGAGGVAPGPGELRVATYNVALAFDASGRLNVKEVAAVLAELDVDIIGLQEVPRGHLPSGGVDMVGWLQRSLGVRYVAFQPSAPGALHGNAVLSRYPIRQVETREFTRTGTALPRGALAVDVRLPGSGSVRFITAHLPPGGMLGERAERVTALVELWGDQPRTIVGADLNAQPGSDIVSSLADAGLTSSWDPTWGPGHTYPSEAPAARIDWILHSPDLRTVDAVVHPSTASDHLPVVTLIGLGG